MEDLEEKLFDINMNLVREKLLGSSVEGVTIC